MKIFDKNKYLLLTNIYIYDILFSVKEVDGMRKAFTTSIDDNISNEFKANCAKDGMQMNKVLEMLMQLYNSGKFKVEINGYFDSIEEK